MIARAPARKSPEAAREHETPPMPQALVPTLNGSCVARSPSWASDRWGGAPGDRTEKPASRPVNSALADNGRGAGGKVADRAHGPAALHSLVRSGAAHDHPPPLDDHARCTERVDQCVRTTRVPRDPWRTWSPSINARSSPLGVSVNVADANPESLSAPATENVPLNPNGR
jgi:hypothetical protein